MTATLSLRSQGIFVKLFSYGPNQTTLSYGGYIIFFCLKTVSSLKPKREIKKPT